jgi:hypothetical protein
MLTYNESKEIHNDIKKDPVTLLIFRIFLGLLLIVFLIVCILFFVDGYNGKHVTLLWGLAERNTPKIHPDTVYSTITKHDTVYQTKAIIVNPKSKGEAPKISQKNDSGDNYSNSGHNEGIIGPNGTIIKEEKFHPDEQLLGRIKDSSKSKLNNIIIKYEGAQQKKNKEFGVELMSKLNRLGYPNVHIDNGLYMWNIPDKRVEIYVRDSTTLILFINLY